MRDYVALTDSLPDRDTTQDAFRLLKAVAQHDTAALESYGRRMEDLRLDFHLSMFKDSCIPLTALHSMGIEEGYRFAYWISFNPSRIIITVWRTAGDIRMEARRYNETQDRTYWPLVQKEVRVLSGKEWQRTKNALVMADFCVASISGNEYS